MEFFSEDKVEKIVVDVPVVSTDTFCKDVLSLFEKDHDLLVVAVLQSGRPVGLVHRGDFIQRLASRFGYAVYEKRHITELMNDAPMIVDASNQLDFLINLLVTNDTQALLKGFVICRGNEYLGIGTALSLLQAQNERSEKRSEELLNAKNIAEQANRSKSEFLANMNHELRTPLNAIIGFTDIMQRELYGKIEPNQYREYVDIVNSSGTHLLGTINSILEMSKIEAGMLELKEEEIDIIEVIQSAVNMVRGLAEKKAITIKSQYNSDIPLMIADQTILRQVMLNLLSNAIKFSAEDTEISIMAYLAPTGSLVVDVIDQGVGIAEEDLERIMTPFYQVDGSHARMEEGTGLGLSIIKKYLDLHEADLDIKSTVGVGTEISISFPECRICPIGQEVKKTKKTA